MNFSYENKGYYHERFNTNNPSDDEKSRQPENTG